LVEALELAAAAWRLPGVPEVRVRVSENVGPSLEDATNVVQFRSDRWCPFEIQKPCYPSTEAARTLPFARPAAGFAEVTEADIELNAVDFRFDDGDAGIARLRSTLLHEMGHLLGLGHACGPKSRYSPSAVTCEAPHDASVMHPSLLAPGHVAPARPSAADLAALQALYDR
jgi:hypothetical protein